MSEYKEQLQKILSGAYPQIEKRYKLEFKNCFGAMAGYADGNIFCSYGKFGFALKLPLEDVRRLLKEEAEPLKYFLNGHVKKDYAVLPEAMINNEKQLNKFIGVSITFVTTEQKNGEKT